MRKRVRKAVHPLNETVLEIRTSIFDLQAGDDLPGLRWRLLDLVSELTEDVPVTPTVRMTGTVDNCVSDDVGEHVEVVAREAVSNAVRHVRAKDLVLTVEAGLS